MTDKKQPVEETTETESVQEATANPTELNLQDLSAMKTIIDIASSRGAFKPSEMVAVGQTYNKLASFLDQVAKQAEEAKAANG